MKKVSKRDIILEAIIKEYIKSKAPIGSSELKQKLTLNMSPSTIRIYFKSLSNEGALVQLHVSSGRVPTYSALQSYWIERINPNEPVVIEDVKKVKNSVKNHGIYCVVSKNKKSTFNELINVSDRYLILAFDEEEVVLKYHPKVEKFLKEFVGVDMADLKSISYSVGLNELYNKLEQIFFQNALLKEGEKELYKIASELNNEEFIEKLLEPKFSNSLGVGIYFDDFVPEGCMAVKNSAVVEKDDAQMFCFGKLESDFESFFNDAKE